jgi:hypothetical protein
MFTKTFKGYEDRVAELDKAVNDWMVANDSKIKDVIDIKAVLSHEHQARAATGDLIYVVTYRAAEPLS